MKKVIEDTRLTNIADAIREKTGKSGAMTVADMPEEILGIVGGGGEYDLYAGKDAPTNASDGDYWVDTSDEGGGVVQIETGVFDTGSDGSATVNFGFSPDFIRVSNPNEADDDVAISDFFLWVSGIPLEQDGGQYKSVNCAIDQDSGSGYFIAEARKLTDSEFQFFIGWESGMSGYCGVGVPFVNEDFEYTAYKFL